MTGSAPTPRDRRGPVRALLSVAVSLTLAWPWGGAPAQATDSLVIRVGILVERPSVRISADGPVTAEDLSSTVPAGAAGSQALPELSGGAAWIVTGTGAGGLDFSGVVLGPAIRLVARHGLLRADGRPYRGMLEVRRTPAGHVSVVNVIDLEFYLYGVIKAEVDPRWPPEAVRAQAIAARTLAIQRMLAAHPSATGASSGGGFDLPATTDAQVYLGAAAEDPAATAAVEATRGLIATYDDRPIFAAYHSNSGGHTEDSENVWGTVYPYLRGVPDPYALDAPGVTWSAVLPLAAIETDLRRGGADLVTLDDVSIGRATPWGRVVTVVLRSDGGRTQEVNANRFRLLVGASVLRSAMFSITRRGGAADFAGRGSGHGVGLDQWGARAMAARGFTFQQILKFYYTGVTVGPRY